METRLKILPVAIVLLFLGGATLWAKGWWPQSKRAVPARSFPEGWPPDSLENEREAFCPHLALHNCQLQ